MPQALYRKYRPRKWNSVIGQDHIIKTLRNAVANERVGHAYLFAGPRGTGKTTTARLLAKAVNCLYEDPSQRPCDECEHCLALNAGRFLDLIEIDAASNTSVDDVRDLRDKINFSPNQGRYKVYVVDEVHMLSTAAFNALLKTLEEPPPHAIFVLATTEVHKIPATVLSRCQRHEFRRIPVADIIKTLEDLASQENIQATPEALTLIARQSTGSLRDAISLLDQLASTGEPISLELTQSVLGTATSQAVIDLVDALISRDTGTGLDLIHRALDSGSDLRQFARQIVEYLRSLLLFQLGDVNPGDITPEMAEQIKGHAGALETSFLLELIHLFNKAAVDSKGSWQPGLPLEIAFIGACQTQPATVQQNSRSAPATSQSPGGGSPPRREETKIVQESPPNSPKPSPGDDSLSNLLNHNWPQVLSMVRNERPNLYALLASCQSRYMHGNVLILGFASDLLKNMMSKREDITFVRGIVSQVLGTEVEIRCTITSARSNDIPTEVDDDGMVASALRDLGGEIVDIQ